MYESLQTYRETVSDWEEVRGVDCDQSYPREDHSQGLSRGGVGGEVKDMSLTDWMVLTLILTMFSQIWCGSKPFKIKIDGVIHTISAIPYAEL